jgi:hypothetical protein
MLIALIVVAALFGVFWTTRGQVGGKKWFSRIAAFGVPATLLYFVARARA